MSNLCGSGGHKEVDGHETIVDVALVYNSGANALTSIPLGFTPKNIRNLRIEFYRAVAHNIPNTLYSGELSEMITISPREDVYYNFSLLLRNHFNGTISSYCPVMLRVAPSLDAIEIVKVTSIDRGHLGFRIFEIS